MDQEPFDDAQGYKMATDHFMAANEGYTRNVSVPFTCSGRD